MSFWRAFGRIANYDRIPPPPRLLATEYDPDDLTEIEARLMARMGIRDKSSIKAAMASAGVSTPEELLALLAHYRPRRRFWRRVWLGLARMVGGLPYQPHVDEIRRLQKRGKASREVEERLKNVIRKMDDNI